jgi:hypothetical protein
MNLQKLSEVFEALLPGKVFHYFAGSKGEKYIVWAEDGQADSTHADNRMQEQTISGTLDLFTKIEFDPLFNQVQSAMNKSEIAWGLESIQREELTGYIHYEWSWEVCNKVG